MGMKLTQEKAALRPSPQIPGPACAQSWATLDCPSVGASGFLMEWLWTLPDCPVRRWLRG